MAKFTPKADPPASSPMAAKPSHEMSVLLDHDNGETPEVYPVDTYELPLDLVIGEQHWYRKEMAADGRWIYRR